jgi:signal peptide peptidase SppA
MATKQIKLSDDYRTLGIDHLDQYAGVWCVEPLRFMRQLEILQKIDLRQHVSSASQRDTETDYTVSSGGIAQIRIAGTMTKYGSSMSSAGSTIVARRKINKAASDPEVKGILLEIESPGGTSAGTQELADAVHKAAQIKAVYGSIEDIGASAAYYVASQATRVFANEPAVVGSIGTFLVVQDSSGESAQSGVTVHVIKAGEFKGLGVPGTPVTESQLAYLQELINAQNELFVQSVMRGRRRADGEVRSWADGRVFMAKDALAMGLIDGIATAEQVMAELRKETRKLKGTLMSDESENKPQPAMLAELKTGLAVPASLAGRLDTFLLECLERQKTLLQAKDSWQAEVAAALDDAVKARDEAIKQRDEALAKAKAAEDSLAAVPGLDKPIGTKPSQKDDVAADPIQEWNQAIDAVMSTGVDRATATIKANKLHPGLAARVREFASSRR